MILTQSNKILVVLILLKQLLLTLHSISVTEKETI